jgi:AcrR family transcriptional regulator
MTIFANTPCFVELLQCRVYTVEVKGLSAMTEPKSRARRGIDRLEILDAALNLFASVGETSFSIRKLAASVGVDPMTVLHHFGSKAELLRAVADHALRGIEMPHATANWRDDLKAVANAYRMLAHRHPRVFHLHFRYNATGPADHISSEIVYCALRRAGLADAETAGLGLAFYAFVLGFALAEAEGLLRPLGESEEVELDALDPEAYKATRALIPAFKKLDPDAAFEDSVEAFILGVAALAERKPHQSPRKAKAEAVAN